MRMSAGGWSTMPSSPPQTVNKQLYMCALLFRLLKVNQSLCSPSMKIRRSFCRPSQNKKYLITHFHSFYIIHTGPICKVTDLLIVTTEMA